MEDLPLPLFDTSCVVALKNLLEKQSDLLPSCGYLYQRVLAEQNMAQFKAAFAHLPKGINIFFAAKSNPYIGLLKTVVGAGEGIDVSSVRELDLALAAGAKKIIYTGPAKTESDFEQILQKAPQAIIHLESLRELKLLNTIAQRENLVITCGIRIYAESQSDWNKFGTPLSGLRAFFEAAQECQYIDIKGLHFHISMNKSANAYVSTLTTVADYCEKNFSLEERSSFSFLDIGGGFSPHECEALYTWNPDQHFLYYPAKSPLKKILNDEYQPRTLAVSHIPIEKIAAEIVSVFVQRVSKVLPNVQLYAEPGRFICHNVMHILLRLVDLKSPNIGITDGGTNMIGWEKYQFSAYSPVFNISQFSTAREIPFLTYGSLCTPDDIWGYYLYSKGDPQPEDQFLIPFQGAYTYTLAQDFIKGIPTVFDVVNSF